MVLIGQYETAIMVHTGIDNPYRAIKAAHSVTADQNRRQQRDALDFRHLEAWRHQPTRSDRTAGCSSVYAFSAGLPGLGKRR